MESPSDPTHSIDQPGKVTKLSVAVVLDNKMLNGTPTAWTTQELQEFQDLIGNAVGIDSARDDIKVTSIPFDTSLKQHHLEGYSAFGSLPPIF